MRPAQLQLEVRELLELLPIRVPRVSTIYQCLLYLAW